MAKSQYISWATILLVLSGTNIAIAQTATASSQPKSFQIAQKNSDDEMLDALQERDKK